MIDSFQTHLLVEAVRYFYYCFFFFFFILPFTSPPPILAKPEGGFCVPWAQEGALPCPWDAGSVLPVLGTLLTLAEGGGWATALPLFPVPLEMNGGLSWGFSPFCWSGSGKAASGAGISLSLPSPAASWCCFGPWAGYKACRNLSLTLRARP